jgi:hypothetical protein
MRRALHPFAATALSRQSVVIVLKPALSARFWGGAGFEFPLSLVSTPRVSAAGSVWPAIRRMS